MKILLTCSCGIFLMMEDVYLEKKSLNYIVEYLFIGIIGNQELIKPCV